MVDTSESPQDNQTPIELSDVQSGDAGPLFQTEEAAESVYARNIEVVRNAVMKAARLVNARGLLVLVARPDQGALVALDCSYGFAVNDYSTIHWPLHGGILAKVFSEQRSLILSAPSTDPDEFYILTNPNIKNAAIVPLSYTWRREGKPDRIETIGVLIAAGKQQLSGEPDAFTDEDLDILAQSSGRISSLLAYTDLYSVSSEAVHQFRLSIQSLRSGFLAINKAGIIYEMNGAVEQILGIPNVQGEHFTTVFTEKLVFLKGRVERVFSSGQSDTTELDMEAPGEGGKPVQKKFRIQFDPVYAKATGVKAEVTGIVLLLTDITSSSPSEQTLAEAMGQIVHDLRIPLTVIGGWADTAWMSEDTDLMNEALEAIQLQSRRMKRMVYDLLDISRILAGRSLAIEQQPFNLHEILSGLVADFRDNNTKDSVVFDDLDYRTDKEEIRSDPDRIAGICGNFLSNAMKYSPEKGREEGKNHVRLVVTEEGEFLRIAVVDQGMGIPKPQLGGMFKPYFRVHSEDHRKVKGTGLGLYLCRCVVEALGGTIGVESEWKRGSTFYFTVPIGNA